MRDLLEAAVRAAREAGADDVEVSHAGRDLGTTRFAGSRLTQAGTVVESTTRVRVARGGRIGSATTSGLDAGSLAEAARRAAAGAAVSPVAEGFPGFARPDERRAAGATGVAGRRARAGPPSAPRCCAASSRAPSGTG
jgi:predicted Zn-dependent protease